jgi:chemotaxis protein methyltransferase CheR
MPSHLPERAGGATPSGTDFKWHEPPQREIAPESFEGIGRILHGRYGFVLDSYKDNCVKRRINIRIRATLSPSAEAYLELLTQSEAEQDRLMSALTIHVSQFFRNPSTFELLASSVIPQILEFRPGPAPIAFWSVGCAQGEEPYSLALLMKERFAAELIRRRVSIVGTDVDRKVLDAARGATYPKERLTEVGEPMRGRWFIPRQGGYGLSREVRCLVDFREADLHDRDSFLESDLILCRNVLIYFERKSQEEVLSRFAEVLRPGGMLVLGKSETMVGPARSRFEVVSPAERVYRLR